MNSKLIMIIALGAFTALAAPVQAQEDSARVVYYVGKNVRTHPDGAIGTIGFHGLLTYGAVNKGHVSGPDIQKYDVGFSWVADSRVTLSGRFITIDEDSLRYEMSGGLTLYTRNPNQAGLAKNPDGCVGGPAITIMGGLRYPDLTIDISNMIGDFSLAVPVSRQITLKAGYRYFENIEPNDAQQLYGGLNLYLASYSTDDVYSNPDGPIGVAAFSLTGGGSSKGFFGELAFVFPISPNLTWRLLVRGERIDEPYRRVPIGGAGVSFYPGN